MKKTFCLDTNVLLQDPKSMFSFDNNDVIVPLIVLEELDSIKVRKHDDAARNARAAIRIIDELRQMGNLIQGVELPSGGLFKIVKSDVMSTPDLDLSKADNRIIHAALKYRDENDANVVLLSLDLNVRIKCDAMGLECSDYISTQSFADLDSLYGGVRVIVVAKEYLDEFFATRKLKLDKLAIDYELMPNEYVVLKSAQSTSGLAKRVDNELRPIKSSDDVWGLKPRNKEQKFAVDALVDDEVKLVTLTGRAGSGKTILALAAGMKQVLEEKKYSRLIVTRPIQPVGHDIGYLPGTKEEKMAPWIQPIVDNLESLVGSDRNLQMYFDRGDIEVEAITYIRGRSIANTYMIIDESQNLTVHELKTIITRAGEGSKIVLTGDIEQVDTKNLDTVSNGLTYVIEKFKEYAIASHITLKKGERSTLATIGSEIL